MSDSTDEVDWYDGLEDVPYLYCPKCGIVYFKKRVCKFCSTKLEWPENE